MCTQGQERRGRGGTVYLLSAARQLLEQIPQQRRQLQRVAPDYHTPEGGPGVANRARGRVDSGEALRHLLLLLLRRTVALQLEGGAK